MRGVLQWVGVVTRASDLSFFGFLFLFRWIGVTHVSDPSPVPLWPLRSGAVLVVRQESAINGGSAKESDAAPNKIA